MSMSDRAVDVGVEPRQLKTVYKTIWYDKKKYYPLYCLYIRTVYYNIMYVKKGIEISSDYFSTIRFLQFQNFMKPAAPPAFLPSSVNRSNYILTSGGRRRECTVNKHA